MTGISLPILWRIFFYGWFASELYIGIATRTRDSSGTVRDRGTLRLLWIVITCSVTACIWFGESNPSTFFGSVQGPKVAAICVIAVGLALRWAAIITLGKSFSSNVAIHATQTVLKTGLYRWMRHPSYTGLLLCFIAIGLHEHNWISLLIITVPTTAALLYRIHVEEIALREAFGGEYVQYSSETRRLIPGIY